MLMHFYLQKGVKKMSFLDDTTSLFKQMIDYRKSVGFATATYECSIPPFIEYSAKNHPDANQITKEMVDEWLEYYSFQTSSTQSVFIAMLRKFTGFINAQGQKAFIPDEDYSVKREQYHPYIFNDNELLTLFNTIDAHKPYRGNGLKYKTELILPVLFQMMYCCGMRPAEPLHLRCEDVDLSCGDIYIRQTKSNKERHIIMSDDMLRLCRIYISAIGKHEWFFPHPDGGRLSTNWMTYQFHVCWKNSGLKKRGNPRPYDFRHAFATRTIMRWIDEGKDVMVLLPYLSTYLGHAEIRSTFYYIHLLPDRIRKSSGIDWDMFSSIYEEVES